MNKYNLTIKDVTDDMHSVTEADAYWWAYLHRENTLKKYEDNLERIMTEEKNDKTEEHIAFMLYIIVETKKNIVELYNKLSTFENHKKMMDQGMFDKPDWMDDFLNVKNED